MSSVQDSAISTSAPTIKVLLVEDQEVLRLGLRLSFTGISDIEMVGEAADGPSAVEQALATKPSLILMDIALPGFDGIVATRKIKAELDTRVLILSSHGEDDYVFPALEAGADGYCLKDVSRDTLITAMRTVSEGHTWLDDTVAARLMRSLKRVDPDITSQHYQLSDTEMNVLYCVLEGATVDEISEKLGIPENKVHAYTRRVLHKIANTASISETTPDVTKHRNRKITMEHQLARICSKCRVKLPMDADVCPFDGADAKTDKMVGTTFADRYEILSVLGSGSGGTVYKARHRFMNKLAAIKVMHSELMLDLDLLQRFRQEASAASALEHPNVVRVVDFGVTTDGTAFMIQDYLEGLTLRELIDKDGALPAPLAVEIFKQICLGMGYAHREGIIHRDLKPSNVLVSGYDKPEMRVKIADFGVAKLVNGDNSSSVQTEFGLVIGSPLYMAPEQCRGQSIDKRADIYSMGCLMYEALTGVPPFVGKDALEVMYYHVNCEVPNIANTNIGRHLPAILNGIVMKALRKDPDVRYRSMEELMVYLDGAVI